jgi:hypothetical protein
MKKVFLFVLFFIFSFLSASSAKAVCPLCTVAVGAGVGLSRWLGIDDIITGLWLGGLTASMAAWTIDWLKRKKVQFTGLGILTTIIYYLTIIISLYFSHIISHPINTFCGCIFDKLLIGIITGGIAFYNGTIWYDFLKKQNNNKAYFPFQKVVMPILPLALLSIIFSFLV